ncbi:MAG: hypothetical protein IJG47_08210, partial [Microbacterium sp.]|nr:hypothetical protein [Microbacterium sp.]
MTNETLTAGTRKPRPGRWLAGWLIAGLGTVILAVSLEQTLAPEEAEQLLTRAAAAGIVGAIMLGIVLVLFAVAYLVSGSKDTRKKLGLPFLIALAPVGISCSLALSLAVNGLTALGAAQIGRAGPILVTIVGFVLIACGRLLT